MSYIFNTLIYEIYIYKKSTMAKKINSTKNKKNLIRTSTMARAVSEGE